MLPPPSLLCDTVDTTAYDIAPNGLVAGVRDGCRATVGAEAVRWSATTAFGFGSGARDVVGHGVNSSAQVVASASGARPEALRSDGGGWTVLQPSAAHDDGAGASAIDESGRVAGVSYHVPDPDHWYHFPTVWSRDGLPSELPLADGDAWGDASGISDDGSTVAGQSGYRAARWEDGSLELLDGIGRPPTGNPDYAWGANNAGDVVGVAHDSAGYGQAVLWPAGTSAPQRITVPRKFFGADARAIDSLRRVVGSMWPRSRAFAWTAARGVVDLNSLLRTGSGWTLEMASGINDAGEVSGTGVYNGARRAFRLKLPAGF